MNFDELSNNYFRFSIRIIGAELEGGAVIRPPAERRWRRPPARCGIIVDDDNADLQTMS